jgi:hypothetical protein
MRVKSAVRPGRYVSGDLIGSVRSIDASMLLAEACWRVSVMLGHERIRDDMQ